MEYQVNFGFHAFAVPSAVVDNLIRLAKEEHLKVLLYILRYPDKQLTVSQIAAFLRMPEEQADEAVQFWSAVSILEEKSEGRQLELFPSVLSAPVSASPPPPEPESTAPEVPAPTESKSESRKQKVNDPFKFFTPESISEMIDFSPELRKLIRLAEEKYYRRLLNPIQTKSLVWMHEYLGMPLEVILILLQYCSDTGNMKQRYIDKMASAWYEENILTPESAEQKVHELMEYHTFKHYICRLFKLTATTRAQDEMIEVWQEMGFSEEMLMYAHDLCVETTGRVNFKYIHPILCEWHEKHITELADAEKYREKFIQQYVQKNKKGRKKKADNPISEEKKKELDEYLSLVNVFEEDTNQ